MGGKGLAKVFITYHMNNRKSCVIINASLVACVGKLVSLHLLYSRERKQPCIVNIQK